jgi:hypothetical protein
MAVDRRCGWIFDGKIEEKELESAKVLSEETA